MADRFERLFELPNNLYSEGSPVIVTAGALLKDTQTGSVLVQLKYQSVSSAPIKALRTDIVAYDITGGEIQGKKNYQYLDLNILNGQTFGSNKAIVMPDVTTRSFSIGSLSVVLSDGSTQSVPLPLTELPTGITLHQKLGNAELVKQYCLTTNSQASQVPCESLNLWKCACGEWNRENSCTRCRLSKHKVFSSYDLDVLATNMKERLAAEQEAQRKVAEQQAAEEKRRKATNKKIAIFSALFATIAAVVLVFSCWLYPDIIAPSKAYNEADALFNEGKYDEAASAFQALGDYKDSSQRLEDVIRCMMDDIYEYGLQLMQQQDYEVAIEQFELLDGYKDAETKIEEATIGILDLKYSNAEKLLADGQYEQAIDVFLEIINYGDVVTDYRDSMAKIEEAENGILANKYSAAEDLYNNGEKIAAALSFAELDDYSDAKARSFVIWGEITQRDTIAAHEYNSVAVKSDGTVVATGANWDGECDVYDWNNVVAVSMGDRHTIGLKSDGTVVATGYDDDRLYVGGWHDIVAISAGYAHSVGLMSDGTVVATGENWDDQCEVDDWSDIIAISAGEVHTVGLKSDGTVVATDISSFADGNWGQCEVSDWKDIVAICAGDNHTVGLKADGTVVAVGLDWTFAGVEEWTDIIAISASGQHTFGLKSDGTVLRVGRTVHDYGSYDVSGWRDIVAIHTSQNHTLGLKSNGTVVAIGNGEQGQCDVSSWNNILLPTKKSLILVQLLMKSKV